MEHNDNERRLTMHAQQQATPAWRMDNEALASPAALALVGLGKAATYLENIPSISQQPSPIATGWCGQRQCRCWANKENAHRSSRS